MDLNDYLAAVPKHRRQRLDSIRQLVRELYPGAIESMRYKMPTFEHERGWISIANQKQYISLYTCMADHIAGFKTLHPHIKTGRGCINFRDRHEISLHDLKPVIISALEFKRG